PQFGFLEAGGTHELCVISIPQQLQMLPDDEAGIPDGGRNLFFGNLLQLNQQTLCEIAVGYSDRVELLDAVQYGCDLVQIDIQRCTEPSVDGFQAAGEHAIGIDGVNDCHADQAVGIGHGGEIELPGEMI